MKTYNYYELVKYIGEVCLAHPFVNNYYSGVYRVNTESDICYPCIAFTLNNTTQQDNTITYNFNLLYADRLTDGLDNALELQSTGIDVLMEIRNALNEYFYHFSFDGGSISTYRGQFSDLCAGAVLDSIQLTVPSHIGNCYYLGDLNVGC